MLSLCKVTKNANKAHAPGHHPASKLLKLGGKGIACKIACLLHIRLLARFAGGYVLVLSAVPIVCAVGIAGAQIHSLEPVLVVFDVGAAKGQSFLATKRPPSWFASLTCCQTVAPPNISYRSSIDMG